MVGVFGNIIVDLAAEVESYPAADDEVEVHSLKEIPGGTGANTAVAAARLGAETVFFGTVGSDYYGQFLIDSLLADNVKPIVRKSDKFHTAMCIAVYDSSGDRRLMTYLGPNLDFEMTEETRSSLKDSSIIHISGGNPYHWSLVREELSEGAKLSFDPGSMVCRTWPDETLAFSLAADYVFLNKNEWSLLGKESVLETDGTVFLKLGKEGGRVYEERKIRIEWEAVPVKQIDSTAAGDVFDGAILYGVDKGLTLEESIQIGRYASSITVSRIGAQSSMPTMVEVRKFIHDRGET
ncbi:carbohydrate kinase family protein [Mesotoga sp.]|uniref:carbohydrate kinase family protein n=1 Tax=Mesotoga sp. TaxID=2053577 RepID=UPI00345E74B0